MNRHTPLWRFFTGLFTFYAAEGGEGGSGDGEGNDSGGTPPPEDGSQGGGSSKLPQTQEELDALIQSRLSRATRGTIKPEEFGFKTKAELDQAIKEWTDRKEEDKSEQDRLVEEAKKQGRSEAESELIGKANARLVKSEFIAAARDRGVVSPTDLYLIAQAEGRFTDVNVNDEDEVEGLDDSWWEELLTDRAHLVAKAEGENKGDNPRTPGGNVNGGSGAGGSKTTEQRQKDLSSRYPALNRR